ncbi:protein-L-isoaspartate(D-aspartate) O-methyltransferase isoform X3 [Mesocricetus auratus]|uniref:Protein-L-isoaspartate(D-aspartate) O-methyltransferase n=1 Tax=Mesocricetus auratus TaxID=10036 RepID=A0ABM2YH74_MESAU|nr:protein-L-isoaspartate(D-aspartate) O-methyltransferase isoform X3 [Mesocricetus auratus]
MPGARSGGSGSGSDGSNSGRSSGDSSGAVTVWEVVSLLGKLLGTVAALKVVLYLLRVCFAMAWKSGGASHSELIHNLRKNGIIKTDKVFEVMLSTDRSHYAKSNPYMDSPQSIGFQATISAPHMHAYALELLFDQLHEGAKALDVGSGSGILTACFARMVGQSGKVIGIDHIKELVDDSINNVKKDDPMLLSSGRVRLVGMNCNSNVSLASLYHCSGLLVSVLTASENQQHHSLFWTLLDSYFQHENVWFCRTS